MTTSLEYLFILAASSAMLVSGCAIAVDPAETAILDDGDAMVPNDPLDADLDAGVCGSNKVVRYHAGCGEAATTFCAPSAYDACFGVVRCSCDGVTYVDACGFSAFPYASDGPCPGDDAGWPVY